MAFRFLTPARLRRNWDYVGRAGEGQVTVARLCSVATHSLPNGLLIRPELFNFSKQRSIIP